MVVGPAVSQDYRHAGFVARGEAATPAAGAGHLRPAAARPRPATSRRGAGGVFADPIRRTAEIRVHIALKNRFDAPARSRSSARRNIGGASGACAAGLYREPTPARPAEPFETGKPPFHPWFDRFPKGDVAAGNGVGRLLSLLTRYGMSQRCRMAGRVSLDLHLNRCRDGRCPEARQRDARAVRPCSPPPIS